MLQSINWQATDTLIRARLAVFNDAADQAGLSEAERANALHLPATDWAAWTGFAAGGVLPPVPDLQDFLRRLATTSFRIVRSAQPVGRAA